MKAAVWLCLAILVLVSCSDDDNASDRSLFLGNYEGEISFRGSEPVDFNGLGTVAVKKDSEFWLLDFPEQISDLDSLVFETNEAGTVMMNTDADSTHLIRITPNTLQVVYTEDENIWQAHCVRD